MRWIFLIVILISQSVWAYIPPTRIILSRVSENAGNGTYIIEQEVQMSVGIEPIYLKETWVVENERTLRLTVQGTKDLKDLIRLQYLYVAVKSGN